MFCCRLIAPGFHEHNVFCVFGERLLDNARAYFCISMSNFLLTFRSIVAIKLYVVTHLTSGFFFVTVTVTAKTNLTRSRVSVVVSPILKSEFSTWVRRKLVSMTSHCACTLSLMNWNSCLQRLWKLDVSVAISTWLRTVVKISSTSACDFTPSTLSVSTKCCHVLELIGK